MERALGTLHQKYQQYSWQPDNSYATQPTRTTALAALDSINMRDTNDLNVMDSQQNPFDQQMQSMRSKSSKQDALIAQLNTDIEEQRSAIFAANVEKDGLARKLKISEDLLVEREREASEARHQTDDFKRQLDRLRQEKEDAEQRLDQ